MLSHQVFFTLKDGSEQACANLVVSCHKYLKHEPGTVFFSAGTLTPDLKRPVNDHDFDVSLNVVFESRAAHDAYQSAENHLAFIAENKEGWKQVRVFDSDVS
ncbi:MAG: stress responsive protein [Planctomycetaceae bacterium]|nr:stress responsive protein [Planctomycetaceae bacterium]